MNKYYKNSNTPEYKEQFVKTLTPKSLRSILRAAKKPFKNPHLPKGSRKAGKITQRGGSNSFKTTFTNFTGSPKHAAQTKYRNISVLKQAIDQLKKKLQACEKKNKKLKESNIELSAWKHSMIKLTEKINRGKI